MKLKINIPWLIVFFLIIGIIRSEIDSTAIISFEHTNIQSVLSETNLSFIPAYEWSFSGGMFGSGLPGFANDIFYNELPDNDPLFGNISPAWINPRYTNIGLSQSQTNLNQKPFYNYRKELFSRFDWYRGDYNYGIFGAMLSGRINGDYLFSLYGENFLFAGFHGLNNSNPSDVEQSISTNFVIDVKKSSEKYEIETGFNYKKISIGNIAFSNDFYQLPGRDGYGKRNKRQFYVKLKNNDIISPFSIGGEISNYDYGYYPNIKTNSFFGQGYTSSILGGKSFYFAKDSIDFDFRLMNYSVFLEGMRDAENQVLIGKIRHKTKRFGVAYENQIGFKNKNVLFNTNINKKIGTKINIGIFVRINHYQYPILYSLHPTIQNSPIDKDDFIAYQKYGAFLSWSNKYFSWKSTCEQSVSEFYRPTQNDVTDRVFVFNKTKLKDLFINTQMRLKSPWYSELFVNIQYSPTINENEFYNLLLFGSIKQSIILFNGNLNFYAESRANYVNGGNNLYWFDEFQTIGQSVREYYTNEPLCFSARIGFHVASLHMFYQFYNIEDRQFSNMPGMLMQSQLNVLGVEWYFLN